MKQFVALPRFPAAIAALCFALFAIGGYAQFESGNIYGKVQAKDTSLLPGVAVTLTGVGAPQMMITDGQGNFHFLNLSPGTYSIKAELSGFGTATSSAIGVNVGLSSDVSMTLNPSISESITVTSGPPLLDIRKAGTAINVTKVELEKIPTTRDPWNVLQQAPAVQVARINVGGNQSGQQYGYVAKGAGSDQNTWNVDGVNITDMGTTGASPTYYDFDSFEEMQITTGGSDPRIMTPGVQLNMVTKRGTNDPRGSGRYFYTPGSYQAAASVPTEARNYLAQTNAINFLRDYGAEAGGPIWKDHVWIWGAVSENKISNQNALQPNQTPSFDNTILRNKNAKLNEQISSSNSAVGFYSFGDKVRNARGLSSTRPFETTWHQSGPTKIYKIEDMQIFGSSFYLTGMWSKVNTGGSIIPNGGIGPDANAWRDTSNVWHNSFFFASIQRPQKQYRLDGSKFVDLGHRIHELKFGFGYRSTPSASQSGWPGSTQGYLRYRNPSYCTTRGVPTPSNCAQAFLFRNQNVAYDEKYSDFYVGDTILMGNLTVQAGARYDQQRTKNIASASAANPILADPLTLPYLATGGTLTAQLPLLIFPGDRRQLKWSSVEPRIGLTYTLGADKKSLVRAGYNQYANQIGSTVSLASPLGGASYFYFIADDKNADHIIQRDELIKIQGFGYIDPSAPASVQSATRMDDRSKAPHADEFILGFEHEMLSDFSVGVNYSHRKYYDLLETRAEHTQGKGDFFTSTDYVPAGTAGGTFNDRPYGPVTFYDLKNPNDVPTYFVIRNRPDYNQTFDGLELTATKRLSYRWMLRANISWNDWKEHSGPNSFADPTPRLLQDRGCIGNCNGQVIQQSGKDIFIDAKWTYNITGLYQLPWEFNVSASLTDRQGYARLVRDEVSVSTGTTSVILNPVGSVRFPNVYELDLRAAKDFRFFNRVGVTLSADLFNMPNRRTILQRETVLFNDGEPTPKANNIEEMQSPRVWRFGARISF